MALLLALIHFEPPSVNLVVHQNDILSLLFLLAILIESARICIISCYQPLRAKGMDSSYLSYRSINFECFSSGRFLSNSHNFFTPSCCSLLLKYSMEGVKKGFCSFSF